MSDKESRISPHTARACRRSRRRSGKNKTATAFISLFLVILTAAAVYIAFIIYDRSVLILSVDGTAIGYTEPEAVTAVIESVDAVYAELEKNYGEEYSRPFSFSENRSFFKAERAGLTALSANDAQYIATALDNRLTVAHEVFIDGESVCYLSDPSLADKAIRHVEDELCSLLMSVEGIESACGNTEFSTEEKLCPASLLITENELYLLLCGSNGISESHPAIKNTVQNHKKLSALSGEADIYYKDIISAMSSVEDEEETVQITVTPPEAEKEKGSIFATSTLSDRSAPCEFLVITASASETVYESIEYDIEYIENADRFEDYSFVLTEGEYGIRLAEYSLEYSADGIRRTLVSEQQLYPATTASILIGTTPYDEPGTVTGKMVWPLETEGMLVSSLFNDYREEFDKDTGYHFGMDVQGYKDDPIWAADGGTVIFASFKGSYGNLVIVDHGAGLLSYYAHLSDITVEKDQRVCKGQILGHVGMSGVTTNYHLHFELRLNGQPIDPLTMLPEIELHFW